MLNRSHQQIVCSAKFMDVALLSVLPPQFTINDVIDLIGDKARSIGRINGMQTRGLIRGNGDIYKYKITERGREVADAACAIWSDLG